MRSVISVTWWPASAPSLPSHFHHKFARLRPGGYTARANFSGGPMNWVDLVVLGVIALSGLLAFMRGLVREVLGVGAWIIAAFVASPYGVFPYIAPWVRQQISDQTIADAVAMGAVFLIVLIVLSFVASAISSAVQGVGLGGLDRTLGLVFGLARGALL